MAFIVFQVSTQYYGNTGLAQYGQSYTPQTYRMNNQTGETWLLDGRSWVAITDPANGQISKSGRRGSSRRAK